jgi:hypothetical protein
MLGNGFYPGMITATIGTILMVAVVATSIVIVRRRLRYETWYAVHLLAYAGIALAWFPQIPTGNELVVDQTAADYWRALYVVALALLVGYRVVVPLVRGMRHRLRVVEVVAEGPGVTSLRIGGRGLSRLPAGARRSSRNIRRSRTSRCPPIPITRAGRSTSTRPRCRTSIGKRWRHRARTSR